MAAADHGEPVPDLYRLLGVLPGAADEEITQAWRRRARAEHPDRRPSDAGAPARFRALAEAYQVLGDPARRAAYDQASGYLPGPGAAAPENPAARQRGWVVPGAMTPRGPVPGAPLWAGPVWVDMPSQAPSAGRRAAQEAASAALAELALRYLAGDWDWPW